MEIVTSLATKSIINAAGRRLRGFFATPEKEAALRACVDAGLDAILANAADADRDHLGDVLRQFLSAPDLSGDLGRALVPLLQGNPPDLDELEALFADAGFDASTLPNFDVRTAFNVFAAGFADGVVGSAVLRDELNTRLLMQIRDAVRENAGTTTEQSVDGDRNVTVSVGSVGGDVIVGRPEDDWETFYLKTLIGECDRLDLAPIDEGAGDVRVQLSDVFTSLDLKDIKRQKGMTVAEALEQLKPGMPEIIGRAADETVVGAVEATQAGRRLVILGRPGGGKSTLVNHLVVQLARRRLGHNVDAKLPGWATDDGPLPVRVILRRFAAWLPADAKPEAGLVWKYLRQQLEDVGCAKAYAGIERTLQNDGGIVFFDGLDEVQEEDAGKRSLICKAIERFVEPLDECRVVVTCREYAYRRDDAWRLPDDVFFVVTLAPFGMEQVKAFTETWYRVLGPTRGWNEKRALKEAGHLTSAVEEWAHLRSLAESPLLLTLMAQIHGRDGTLPRDRADLYERTVNLLLATWQNRITRDLQTEEKHLDDDRVLELGVQINDVREALEKVAFQAHERQEQDVARSEGAADIPGDELLHALDEKLGSLDKARDVIAFVQQRAGLLLAADQRIYRFPHRTFQEYLAARYVLKQPEFDTLIGDCVRRELNWWREVYLLAAGASRDTPRIVSDLVDELVPRSPIGDVDLSESELARLAAQALDEARFLERVGQKDRFQERYERVQAWLLAGMTSTASLEPVDRARCGKSLAVLGDPRPEVTTVEGMQFCWVPPGPFWMGGAGKSDGKPLHLNEYLTSGYWMARFPVTVAQFRRYVDATHAGVSEGALSGSENAPAVNVSWHDARAFCAWLTASGVVSNGWEARLPSEAEWEKAARGGLRIVREPLVRVIGDVGDVLNVDLMDNPKIRRLYPWGEGWDVERCNNGHLDVGRSSATGCFSTGRSVYGCEEMSGNVLEWTLSRWAEYPYLPENDRVESGDTPPRWAVRGGSFVNSQNYARCAYRNWYSPSFRRDHLGLRVVLSPSPPSEALDSEPSGL